MIVFNQKLERNWLIAYTRPKFERRVHEMLNQNNIETFLPLYKKLVQRSDRKKKVLTPLFPGYIFTNVNLKEINTVYQIPGVLKFLSTQGIKDVIPQKEIDTLKLILEGRPEVYNFNFELGEEVEIIQGPFVGLSGRLIRYKGKSRLVVLLKNIKQYITVEVYGNHLRSLKNAGSVITI